MTKWNKEKLEQMTQTQNEFTKTKLDYVLLSDKYFEILEKVHLNGDVIPLAFKDVEVCYDGKVFDDISLPDVSDEIQAEIDEKEQARKVMHIKHFSRSISHQAWFDFLDDEVDKFLEKYPEYVEIKI